MPGRMIGVTRYVFNDHFCIVCLIQYGFQLCLFSNSSAMNINTIETVKAYVCNWNWASLILWTCLFDVQSFVIPNWENLELLSQLFPNLLQVVQVADFYSWHNLFYIVPYIKNRRSTEWGGHGFEPNLAVLCSKNLHLDLISHLWTCWNFMFYQNLKTIQQSLSLIDPDITLERLLVKVCMSIPKVMDWMMKNRSSATWLLDLILPDFNSCDCIKQEM